MKSQEPHCKPLIFENVAFDIDGHHLLRDITCRIKITGKSVLIGANGAGKSLFLRLATGLLMPSSGKVFSMVNSQNVQPQSCQSMIFQKPVLLRRSTFANIEFVLQNKACGRDELVERVSNALASAGLHGRAETLARKLSGGEQQRLALARALVVEPAVLFLDEPTASLDPASTKIVEDMIMEADRGGTKIIHVTHDIKQARRLADDILFMHNGRLLLHQKAEAFFAKPGCDQAQAYLDGRIV
jgi:tungstate transport system ATP-binding protein